MLEEQEILDEPSAEEAEQLLEERVARLEALGMSLAGKRSESIRSREESGIEQIWLEDEEFFQGVDDGNRSEHESPLRSKPPGQLVPKPQQSTVFPNITAPYCNAAASKISDILMPSDSGTFAVLPTPVPELIELSKMQGPRQVEATAILSAAKAKADKAQKRIEDWLVECQYHRQMRLVIKDATRLGSGVIKGPHPVKKKTVANIGGALVVNFDIKPQSKRIDPWNLFPDGACGESIHSGSYIWERDYLTPKQLEELKGAVGYIDFQIDKCLTEGPQKAIAEVKREPEIRSERDAAKRFEIWYFHGFIDKDDMLASGCECEISNVPAVVTMVNNHVIKAALNPLDTGEFPYDIMPWQVRSGAPWGKGVARLIRTPQRMIVGATRAMMDNAGKAAGPQVIRKQGIVAPADGKHSLAPWKEWLVAEDADVDDVSKTFAYVLAPWAQVELNNIIQLAMKMAEDVTGLPMLLQGQIGSASDTLGVTQILSNNASSSLRELGRNFDDYITEQHIRRYYNYLLQYGDDDEKGEFIVDARGSSTNVEREIQNQSLLGLLQLSQNPVHRLDPAKTAREYVQSMHFDPKKFEYDDEEWQQIVQNLSQPQDSRLQVAEMMATVAERQLAMKQQFEAKQNDLDRQHKITIKMIDERLSTSGLSSAERQTLSKIKAGLAEVSAKLNVQEKLSRQSLALKPPTEPFGRARNGMSFQQ